MYVFDYTNVADVLNGSKPVLVQKGPYQFMEYFRKFDISWTDDGDTVTYNTQKFYVYNPAASGAGLSLDDRMTIPYVTILGFEWLLRAVPPEANDYFDVILHEYVFGPIEDDLLAELATAHGPRKTAIERVLVAIETLEQVIRSARSWLTSL